MHDNILTQVIVDRLLRAEGKAELGRFVKWLPRNNDDGRQRRCTGDASSGGVGGGGGGGGG